MPWLWGDLRLFGGVRSGVSSRGLDINWDEVIDRFQDSGTGWGLRTHASPTRYVRSCISSDSKGWIFGSRTPPPPGHAPHPWVQAVGYWKPQDAPCLRAGLLQYRVVGSVCGSLSQTKFVAHLCPIAVCPQAGAALPCAAVCIGAQDAGTAGAGSTDGNGVCAQAPRDCFRVVVAGAFLWGCSAARARSLFVDLTPPEQDRFSTFVF